MTPDALAVSAAIRLSPVDSIGVPVFLAGNSMYLPEMDADFNIRAFLHFHNAEGYDLTGLVPDPTGNGCSALEIQRPSSSG